VQSTFENDTDSALGVLQETGTPLRAVRAQPYRPEVGGALWFSVGGEGPADSAGLSNIHRREPWRHHSYVSSVADAVIMGCGIQGYTLAIRRIAGLLSAPTT